MNERKDEKMVIIEGSIKIPKGVSREEAERWKRERENKELRKRFKGE